MITRVCKNASGFLALIVLCGVLGGLLLVILPPLGESPEFARFLLFVGMNFIFGVVIGGRAVHYLGVGWKSLLWALLCATVTALALTSGIGYPGTAAFGIGPVMAGMAYWSAAVSRTVPEPQPQPVG